jgi:hypothetical protein
MIFDLVLILGWIAFTPHGPSLVLTNIHGWGALWSLALVVTALGLSEALINI